MAVHVVGLIALLGFYVIILVIGIAAYWKKTRNRNKEEREQGAETITVARRDIGWIIGSFTMTATWCGGGFINGTAEILFTKGLIQAQLPVGNAISLVIGGLFFAKPMREKKYMTMLDPFRQKYGKRVCSLMYLPAFLSEVVWIGAIVAALGSSVSVVVELAFPTAVSISVAFCVLYVVIGGMYSVTWTDMAEIIFVIFGLVLCTPFIWRNKNVHLFQTRLNGTNASWGTNASDMEWLGLATIEPKLIPSYVDSFLFCIFGAIPWQDYFQRVLSAKSVRRAQILSYVGGFGCILIGIPAAMVGIASRYTDWDAVGYSMEKASVNSQMILPLALEYMTPKVIAFFGVGTVSAAVMSSADASLLSIGGMFAHNIYKPLIRPKASSTEVLWALRCAIVVGGIVAAAFAIFVESVMSLWLFCCDLVYVILFPPLVCVLFIPWTNAAGVVSGYVVGTALRFLAGEPSLRIPAVTKYPLYDFENDLQLFPVKTFAMLMNLLVSLLVSLLVNCWMRRRQAYVVDVTSKEMELRREALDRSNE